MARSAKSMLATDAVSLAALLEVKLFFTLDEAAILLGVGKSTVESLVASGHIGSGILPGTETSRRVSRAQIEAYAEQFDAKYPSYSRPQKARKRRYA